MNQFVMELDLCREHLVRVIGAKLGNSKRLSSNLRFVSGKSLSNSPLQRDAHTSGRIKSVAQLNVVYAEVSAPELIAVNFKLVPRVGLEPTRLFRQQILSLQRLPIPPSRPKNSLASIRGQRSFSQYFNC